jgi:uncharacterized Ntn-hydrolase superfamily protein
MIKLKMQTENTTKAVLALDILFGITCLGLAGNFIYNSVSQDRSTFSIVAIDPETGDVGIAGASCAPVSAGGMTTLVPGKGAAVIQAAFIPKNQAKVFDLLQQGFPANEIIEFMSDKSYDENAEIRQYGVVTLNEGDIQVAGFTGEENNGWAGDQQNPILGVSVQGNTLEDAVVVSNALAAFSAADIGPVNLSDRLLRALEAASAAGGDNRCNQAGFQQTAQAAFITVAKANQLPFAATIGKDPSSNDPALPWLYISVIESKGGPNPILELRSLYNAWRSENLDPCAKCNLDAIPVPAGGESNPFSKAILNIISRIGLVSTGLICLVGVVLMVFVPMILLIRRRKRLSKT